MRLRWECSACVLRGSGVFISSSDLTVYIREGPSVNQSAFAAPACPHPHPIAGCREGFFPRLPAESFLIRRAVCNKVRRPRLNISLKFSPEVSLDTSSPLSSARRLDSALFDTLDAGRARAGG